MKLNFWPFNSEEQQLRGEVDSAYEAHRAELRSAFLNREDVESVVFGAPIYSSGPAPCEDCGGLFVPNKMKSVILITFNSEGNVRLNEKKHYCDGCHSGLDLEIELVTAKGENLDTVYFSVGKGYLQPFNFQGEEQTLIGVDDYARAMCEDCEDVINPEATKTCRKCTTRRKK